MSVEEARVKILNLAAEVAETEDYNVPIQLQQLQGIFTELATNSLFTLCHIIDANLYLCGNTIDQFHNRPIS